MSPDEILAVAPRVLTQEQREFYFREGYLLLPGVIDAQWLERLRGAPTELVEPLPRRREPGAGGTRARGRPGPSRTGPPAPRLRPGAG